MAWSRTLCLLMLLTVVCSFAPRPLHFTRPGRSLERRGFVTTRGSVTLRLPLDMQLGDPIGDEPSSKDFLR
eukprot:620410-Rhodomonas_salina.1